jgi:hypothetical protein
MRSSTTIKLPTYGCQVVVSVVDTVSVEANRLYKKHDINEQFGMEAEGALVMPDSVTYYLILAKSYLTHNTIAHEVFHTTVRVTEDRDITDEEAQAWLAGHISGVIYKFLQKKKLQVKHG